jgi:hypothetical protein
MLEQGGWWCVHNDEVGCVEVRMHYGIGV